MKISEKRYSRSDAQWGYRITDLFGETFESYLDPKFKETLDNYAHIYSKLN